MSQDYRLSELTGISAHADDSESFWPLNIVLVLLGAGILGVSFYYLDPQDERLTYNPWTYAIATPIALLILSALLSTVVSRVIEKSMQLSLLLSVLVHLILLVYAVNIVIFSRMWPEILDSLAQERHQLQREALQSRQYYRVSVTTQTGRKPDYLRHQPTQHQPTEIAEADSPALLLARAERANLVSPTPRVERTANPHILERHTPSPSLPADSERAAALSRSDLTRPIEQQYAPEQMGLSEPPEDLALRPSDAAPRRDAPSSRLEQQPSPVTIPQRPEFKPPRLNRSESLPESAALPPQPAPQYDRTLAALPALNATQISTPSLDALASSLPQPLASSSRSELRERVRSEDFGDMTPELPTSNLPDRRLNARVSRRREQEWRVPEPSLGVSSTSITRKSAGGRTGPPAPNSMPFFNPELQAGGGATSRVLSTPSISLKRRATGNRPANTLAGTALAQAPSWNSRPSLAGGIAGVSPTALSSEATGGEAASRDIADLTGTSGPIQRSALGLPAAQGSLALPAQSAPADSVSQTREPAASGSQPQMTPGESVIDRATDRASRSDALALSLPSPSPATTSRLPSALQRAPSRTGPSSAEPDIRQQDSQAALARSDVSAGAPTNSVAQLTNSDSPATMSESNSSLIDISSQISRARRGTSLALDIDMPLGQGGISPVIDSTGPLLPRRSSLANVSTPIDLDAQRFARQQVGGPLAAGQNVVVPKPAFQQRLERLQDRNPLDTTSLEPQTELAIERGLAFLAKHQREDGSWRLQDFDTQVLMRSDTAATGLALLAFQGAGYTHKQFRYADVVGRAIQFLRQHQTAMGDLYIPQDPASDQNAKLYSHAIAALAMCEAYGMTQDPELKEVAQRSLDFMVISQDPNRGGWRYQPGRGTDTSVTGWFMMAFKSGQLAGLEVPQQTYDRILAYLEQSQVSPEQSHLYRYNPYAADTPQQRHGLQPTAVMTSVGLLMRLYFGWQRDRAEMIAGTDYLLRYLPEEGTRQNSRRDTYYWYYATQVLFHMGGERWRRWHDALYPMLIDNQITRGENEGSWDPLSPTPDLWARYGGRLYVTTMNLLSLEVSYRHLPLYEATGYDPSGN